MNDEIIRKTLHETQLVRRPNQRIETFWSTEIDYFVASRVDDSNTILRSGTVICAKPRIISREQLIENFSGFSDEAIKFAESISEEEINRLRAIGYKFDNEKKTEEKMSLPVGQVIDNLEARIESSRTNVAILQAPDDLWNVSLLKIVLEVISASFQHNVQDLEERGMFLTEAQTQKQEIETLFMQAFRDKKKVNELGNLLQDYNLFPDYEERFFQLVDFHK